MWIATAGAAWSAAKHDGVLIALLPHFALFIAIASLGKGPYVVTTVLWCAAAGAFLLVQHADSVLRARTGFQATNGRRSRLLTGGACAAVVALVFGALVGPRLPDAESAPLLDYRHFGKGGSGSQIVDISPLVGVGDKLRQPKPTVLFTVTSTTEARWRLMALDEFDGNYWGLHETTTTSTLAPDGTYPPGVLHQSVTQQYSIGPMTGKFLPAAYRAVRGANLSNAVVIPESATLVVNDESHQGLHYGVTSTLIGASPDTLRHAAPVDSSDPLVAQNLELPGSFDDRIRAEAQRVVGDAPTEYDKAFRLQSYFRDPHRFTYDQSVDLSESDNAMYEFLFQLRRGFCEQFAATFAAMARAVGVPTRVAVGFQPGAVTTSTDNVDGHTVSTYTVTTKEAHAWPEVYFPKIGWIAFEPTPGRYDYDSPGDPNQTHAGAPPYHSDGSTIGNATTTTTPPATVPQNTVAPTPQPKPPKFQLQPPASQNANGHASSGRGSPWLLIPLALIAALVVVLAAVPIVDRTRRWRRARASSPRARIDGAWTQATEALARRDIRRRPAATLVEFALREAPASGAGTAGPPLLELAQLQTRAMYAVDEPTDDDADRAWECVAAVLAALRAQTPLRERIRQRLPFRLRRGGRRRTSLARA